MNTFRTLLSTILVLSIFEPTGAQEKDIAFFGDDIVDVSAEQNERFIELEERLGGEVESIKDEIDEKRAVYEKKRELYETARLEILSLEQRDDLAKMRRQRVVRESREQHSRDVEFLAKLLPILREMHSQKTMQIFEGPQRKGIDKPEAPIEKDSVHYVKKYFFYKEPLNLSEDDEIAVSATIGSFRSFGAYAGGKMCGGFHPDANIQIKTSQQTIQVLVCFGCAEAKFIVGDEELLVDLEDDAYNTLRRICFPNFRRHGPSEGRLSK